LEQIIPDAVIQTTDHIYPAGSKAYLNDPMAPKPKPVIENLKAVRYDYIYLHAVAALQEAMIKIEQLELEVRLLKIKTQHM
jgi:hypothetical protein